MVPPDDADRGEACDIGCRLRKLLEDRVTQRRLVSDSQLRDLEPSHQQRDGKGKYSVAEWLHSRLVRRSCRFRCRFHGKPINGSSASLSTVNTSPVPPSSARTLVFASAALEPQAFGTT